MEYTIEDVANTASATPTYDTEQVTRRYYDFVGRPTKMEEGVSTETHNITGGKPTLKTTSESFYDDPDSDATPEQGDGDGNLRWTRSYYGDGSYNDTEYRYDWRNRRSLTIPPLPPYTLVLYDHLDRVVTTGRYSATTNLDPGDDPATTENANRLGLSKTYFDEWGRVYKTETFEDPADTTPADALISMTYFDRRKLVWATDPANSGISFTVYDGAGRRIQTFSGTQFDAAKFTGGGYPEYPDDNEGIVQLTEYTLNDMGNATQVVTKELNHTDTNGMNLTTSDYIRTYSQSWYDAAHRLTDTVNYGTNNSAGWKDYATAPTYGASAPSRSDTILVTSYSYDVEGRQTTTTDPKAIATLSVYDKLGRVSQKEENDGGGALERITSYTYNAQGSLTKITAELSTDQVTEYVYGSTQNSRWVTKIKYPATDTTNGKTLGQPSDESYDRIVFTYSVDGTLATRTDQNGTVLTWSYDTLRRKTEEEVTTLGSYSGGSVDSAVRSFTWKYDNEGRAQYVTSHTDTTPDTTDWTDAANQVAYTYDAADHLVKEEQEENGKVVGGTTKAVEYGYSADYGAAAKYYSRRDWVKFPDGRKIWNGYTHSDTANTFEDTIDDVFNRVGQIARDNAGSKGDLLAEYDFNGMGRTVRRVHDEGSGAYGNDTRMDLWHGTTGQYDGLDRFGRIVDMKHTDFNGTAADFLRRKYGYDRDGNRTYIDDPIYKAAGQSFTYDNLNRLTDSKRGLLNSSNTVDASDVGQGFNMDLLGNFCQEDGANPPKGVTVNQVARTVVDGTSSVAPSATNETRALDFPNAGGAAILVNDPFTSTLNSYWTQHKGTWSIVSGEASVSTLTSGEAVLLANCKTDVVQTAVTVKFPASSSTKKAGLVFAHDGNNSYFAVVLDRNAGKLALYQVTSGSWGAALASNTETINDSTAYTIMVQRRERTLQMWVASPGSGTVVTYNTDTQFGTGQVGLYADVAGATFDNFKMYDATARDPLRASLVGATDIATGGSLGLVASQLNRGGEAVVNRFQDDDYIVQWTLNFQTGGAARLFWHYANRDNAYMLHVTHSGTFDFYALVDGKFWLRQASTYTYASNPVTVKVKYSSGQSSAWVDGVQKLTNWGTSAVYYGGVAFHSVDSNSGFGSVKIGYDRNADDDIDDVGTDDVVVDESFGSTSVTLNADHSDGVADSWDRAGNMVNDGTFRYVYDAWNRLVKVQASLDADVVYQTAKFDALGRRIKKAVTNAGDNDQTVVYYYDGQRIVETRLAGAPTVAHQQFIHGTQYIDELVMMRVAAKGDLYVHQDANWNVIGTTDLGRHVVERNVYTPYGELTVHQDTGFGDRDGDADVDATDKGTVGTTCTGTVSGSCRVLDLDFDGDYDSGDATKFDALTQGAQRHPARAATAVAQPFAHQGLLFEPELAQYQNRARQYDPGKRRFAQQDPFVFRTPTFKPMLHYVGGGTLYNYVQSQPIHARDASGLCPGTPAPCCVVLQSEMEFSAVLGKVIPNGGKRHERHEAAATFHRPGEGGDFAAAPGGEGGGVGPVRGARDSSHPVLPLAEGLV